MSMDQLKLYMLYCCFIVLSRSLFLSSAEFKFTVSFPNLSHSRVLFREGPLFKETVLIYLNIIFTIIQIIKNSFITKTV